MNLQELISQNKLEEFKKPIRDIRKIFEKGRQRLSFAKTNFNKRTPEIYFDAIYTSIYDSIRLTGEAFLLLNGYRAKHQEHHKTVINVTRALMGDEEDMKNVLKRLNKMRKRRNDLDYDFDTYGVSRTAISKAIEDAEKLAKKVLGAITAKDPQQKIT